MLAAPPSVEAATRTVTKTADTADGVCNADCSLREAVVGAVDTDTVVVPAGTYVLSMGELVMSAAGTISGAGANATVITAGGASRVLRATGQIVTITGVTITGGSTTGTGGGISAPASSLVVTDSVVRNNSAIGAGGGIHADSLMLTRSTVSTNSIGAGRLAAIGGGGIFADLAGLEVVNSTVSGNVANLGPAESGGGGGIHYAGRGATITNSTLSGNRVTFTTPPMNGGGGAYFGGNGADAFLNVTVAGNTATGAPGGGLFNGFSVPITLQKTIVSGNAASSGAGCAGASATAFGSLGANIEFPGNTCNLMPAIDKPNTDPLLGPLASNGGPTQTRLLLPGSPAIDAAGTSGCPATDQRGVTRPQGSACDIGAVEWRVSDAPLPDTVIVSGPTVITRDRRPVFTFSSNTAGASFECSIDGGPFSPCSSPFSTSRALSAGRHTFAVRARGPGGRLDPTPAVFSFAIPAVLSDLPPPKLGRTFNVEPVGPGEVLVSERPGAARARARASVTVPGIKGRNFVPLREARQVAVGAIIDTRKGGVRLVSARDARNRTQSGDFRSGVFQVLQSGKRSAKGLTELRLKGSSFRRCGRVARGKKASAARRSKRRIRRLRSNAKGRFRTRGRYSAATVRGTVWEVADRCDGTLTKVTRGRVAVRDFRRRKSILVKKGKRYLARAPG
jgi:CSLREA domain-containing protein